MDIGTTMHTARHRSSKGQQNMAAALQTRSWAAAGMTMAAVSGAALAAGKAAAGAGPEITTQLRTGKLLSVCLYLSVCDSWTSCESWLRRQRCNGVVLKGVFAQRRRMHTAFRVQARVPFCWIGVSDCLSSEHLRPHSHSAQLHTDPELIVACTSLQPVRPLAPRLGSCTCF